MAKKSDAPGVSAYANHPGASKVRGRSTTIDLRRCTVRPDSFFTARQAEAWRAVPNFGRRLLRAGGTPRGFSLLGGAPTHFPVKSCPLVLSPSTSRRSILIVLRGGFPRSGPSRTLSADESEERRPSRCRASAGFTDPKNRSPGSLPDGRLPSSPWLNRGSSLARPSAERNCLSQSRSYFTLASPPSLPFGCPDFGLGFLWVHQLVA